MYPTPQRPEYGRFVLDQVEALRRRDDVEVEVFSFPPGLRSYPAAARELRRRHGPYLLFPHDPARALKRFDRAQEAAGDVPLLHMGRVAPEEVPYWINAANAVLVPSQAEGFGLSVIEAIACGVPAFGTPVGI